MFDIISDLRWRGLIHQSTDEAGLPGWLAAAPRSLYVGFDPTADSLHVGHMMGLMTLRRVPRGGVPPARAGGGRPGRGRPSTRPSSDRRPSSAAELAGRMTGAGMDVDGGVGWVPVGGITWPLVTKRDGSKMGKTESGAIWLSPARTSP